MLAWLKAVFGNLSNNEPCIDNKIFALHYNVTVMFLVSLAVIMTTCQFVGKPMYCTKSNDESQQNSEEFVNHYCWVTGSFTAVDPWKRDANQITPNRSDIQRRYVHYYPWVWLILFLQAALFYLPRFIWKIAEGNLMVPLCSTISESLLDEQKRNAHVVQLSRYFFRKYHQYYMVKYVICEFLNLLNVIMQLVFVNYMTEGLIHDYGLEIFDLLLVNYKERRDRLSAIFPVLTSCSITTIGPSGSGQNFEFVCFLTLSPFNEKTFIFLWYWFSMLSLITGLNLVHRSFIICSRTARYFMLKSRLPFQASAARKLCNELDLGDWFLLYLLSRNMHGIVTEDLMIRLVEKVSLGKATKVETKMS